MKRIKQGLRLVHINRILVRHGLDEIALALRIFRPVRFMLYLLPWNWRVRDREPRGVRVRRALEDLGPVFVKFGQNLSTRQDLLPDAIARELAGLQNQVPPFPSDIARSIIERELGEPVERLFAEFEDEPLASASIAQVHAARLADGRDVVVKVVRPDIERTIRSDIDLLYSIAELAERYWRDGRRLHVRDVVAEFEAIILDELDLLREASSASLLRRNFELSKILYVPEIIWSMTKQRVMVMERVGGIPIGDLKGLREANVNMRVLAERGVEIFFTQVVRHNFFHADMHPGNIFVDASNPQDPSYVAVDFGIMGSLTPEDQRYLAENFIAFFNRDYRRVAELHLMSRWVPESTRVNDLEAAIRTVCEPVFERPLAEISFGQLLFRLFQIARRFEIEVQPQLVLLQKTLLNIEGLGRQLYPELDLWGTAKPFLEQYMRERVGGKAAFRELQKHAPRWVEALPRMPMLVHDVMTMAADGKLQMHLKSEDLRAIRSEIRRANRRTIFSVVGALLILAAATVYAVAALQPALLWGVPVVSLLFAGLGTLVILLGLRE